MATQSYQSQLEEVQAAITKVLSGQSYAMSSGDGSTISVTRANLDILHDREMQLRKLVSRETRGGIKVIGGTPV